MFPFLTGINGVIQQVPRSKKTGVYRSKAEFILAQWLKAQKIKFGYETRRFEYKTRVVRGECEDCGGRAVQRHTYILDFWLPEYDFGLELKGRLEASDRTKYIAVRDSNPLLDLRFIFLSDNKLHKHSSKRYSTWAADNQFKYAIKLPEEEWFTKK